MSRISAKLEAAIPVPMRGAVWIISAGAFWALMAVSIREAGHSVHVFEVVFFRTLFGALVMVPFLLKDGFERLRTRRLKMHGVRTVFGLGGMVTWFWAIAFMPIAEVTALGYAAPLFVIAGAGLVLKERVGLRRWIAVGVGLAGALIILKPGASALTAVAAVALLSAAFNGVGHLVVKVLARTDTPEAIVFYWTLFCIPMALVPALFVWSWPDAYAFAWLVVLGGAASAGHFCVARAFAVADASAVMPFDFIKLLFSAGAGFLFYAEQPVIWTWIGAAVIFAATLYTAHHEVQASGRAPVRAGSQAGPSGGQAPSGGSGPAEPGRQ